MTLEGVTQPGGGGQNKPNWPSLDAGSRWKSGVLVDRDIRTAMDNNQLVVGGDPARAKYATYELVIGTRIEELVMDNDGAPQQDLYRAKAIPNNGVITIMPGQTFKLYAKEEVYMPCDVTAFAIPVGILYKLGIHPETTFADPGFSGPFFVTICNYSPRVVKLTVGDPLARMFFLRLQERPDRIHDGPPRDMPPAVERVPRPTAETLKNDAEVIKSVLTQVDPPHYEHAFITHRIVSERYAELSQATTALHKQISGLRWVIVGMSALLAASFVVPTWNWLVGKSPSFSEGVLASIVAAGAVAVAVWLWTRARAWASDVDGDVNARARP